MALGGQVGVPGNGAVGVGRLRRAVGRIGREKRQGGKGWKGGRGTGRWERRERIPPGQPVPAGGLCLEERREVALPPPRHLHLLASLPIEALQRGGWKQREVSPWGLGGGHPPSPFLRGGKIGRGGWWSPEEVFRKVMAL